MPSGLNAWLWGRLLRWRFGGRSRGENWKTADARRCRRRMWLLALARASWLAG